jgi:hypothetical protein
VGHLVDAGGSESVPEKNPRCRRDERISARLLGASPGPADAAGGRQIAFDRFADFAHGRENDTCRFPKQGVL